MPLLVYCNIYCNVPIHPGRRHLGGMWSPIPFAGAIGFAVAGWGKAGLPAGSSGYLYWPAVAAVVAGSAFLGRLGARLAHALPVATLRRGRPIGRDEVAELSADMLTHSTREGRQ